MLIHGDKGRGLWRAVGALAGLLVAMLVIAPAAEAACGNAESRDPRKDVDGPPALAIGDSPMLLAVDNLAEAGFRPNARGCRQYPEGLQLIRQVKRRGNLPRLVIVALGSNGFVSQGQLREARRLVVGDNRHKKRYLGVVTPRESGGGSSSDATRVRQFAAETGRHVRLLDWVKRSAGHPNWFQPDGLHLTYSGAAAMTRFFSRLLPLADGKGKREERRH